MSPARRRPVLIWRGPALSRLRAFFAPPAARALVEADLTVYFWGAKMAEVKDEIAAYEKMRNELEAQHMGEWVLVHDLQLIGVYGSFETAAEEAVRRFGRGPYLIRQVGAPPVTLPASVMFHVQHGSN
jgi:hypothetical protein